MIDNFNQFYPRILIIVIAERLIRHAFELVIESILLINRIGL